jgi:hypothetical protein
MDKQKNTALHFLFRKKAKTSEGEISTLVWRHPPTSHSLALQTPNRVLGSTPAGQSADEGGVRSQRDEHAGRAHAADAGRHGQALQPDADREPAAARCGPARSGFMTSWLCIEHWRARAQHIYVGSGRRYCRRLRGGSSGKSCDETSLQPPPRPLRTRTQVTLSRCGVEGGCDAFSREGADPKAVSKAGQSAADFAEVTPPPLRAMPSVLFTREPGSYR